MLESFRFTWCSVVAEAVASRVTSSSQVGRIGCRVARAGLVLAAACALSASATARTGAPRIVALGDSLTSGRGVGKALAYPAVLQERLIDEGYDYEVVNAGVSGDTTAGALRRLREAMDGDVQVLIVALGANDGLRGVQVEQLTSNLSRIIEEAQRRGISVILVGMDALPVRGWAYSVAFHRAYEQLAARYRVPLIPFILLNVMSDPALMQRDRVHPNEAGARAIAEYIWPYLEPLLRRSA
jgi:acyl-CoA thioesterase-1